MADAQKKHGKSKRIQNKMRNFAAAKAETEAPQGVTRY